MAKLTKKEIKYIYKYTMEERKSKWYYGKLNYKLRNKIDLSRFEKKYVSILNSGINKIKLDSKITVYRGIPLSLSDLTKEGLFKDGEFQTNLWYSFNQFVSTSVSLTEAMHFTKRDNSKIKVLFIIEGTRCSGAYIKQYSDNPNEAEVLFPNDLKVFIEDVKIESDIVYLKCKC